MMDDRDRTIEDLRAELAEARRRIARLEAARASQHGTGCGPESNHLFKAITESIPCPVFYKDAGGCFLGCNRAFETRFGLSREEIVGKNVYDLFPRELADQLHRMDCTLMEQSEKESCECSWVLENSHCIHHLVKEAVFSNSDGNPAGLVGFSVDITDFDLPQWEILKAHDDMERRVRERTSLLARANDELRKEIVEKTRMEAVLRKNAEDLKVFSHSVVHDLKSPIIGIYGLTNLLFRHCGETLDDKGKVYCGQILKAAEQILTLVEEMNTYAASNKAPLHIEAVPVDEIFGMVENEFHEQMESRGITWFAATVPGAIRVDRLSFYRVFRNLVENALKYGGAPLTRIAVGYQGSGEFHIFTVHDDGVGINPEDVLKIFRPFHRVQNSVRIEGTGLGLAIVKEIAERHHGTVWAEAGRDRGVTFFVSFHKDL